MKIALPKSHTSHLTNEGALHICQTALEQKDREDYEGAQSTMHPLWKGVGERPKTKDLHASVEAEVLLCAGILTGWIGSKIQVKEAQEDAKNLISESMRYFESAGDLKKVAGARAELAFCYWRAGEMNEARTMLREALNKLTTEGITRARALLKLTTVEWTSARYYEALEILTANANFFQRVVNHAVRGAYHSELAIVLRNLATAENTDEYFQRAINEYKEADRQFRLAHNPIFRADVKNNVGFLMFKLARYKEAHKYLDEARRLIIGRDKARTAQIDETRAQVLIAEGKFNDAEVVAHRAAVALEKSGHQCLVTHALITQGIALARSSRQEHAQFVLQKAIEVAVQIDALNAAGLATLTLIEEVDQLSAAMLKAAYRQAREWLANSDRQDILRRLSDAGAKVVSGAQDDSSEEGVMETLMAKPSSLQDMMLKYENALIKKALMQTNGSVTRAASLLGLSYQALCYMIESRHVDLLKERTPIRRRSGKKR